MPAMIVQRTGNGIGVQSRVNRLEGSARRRDVGAPMNPSPIFHKEENENAPAARTVPLRADMPAADTWDLTPLYPDVAAWQADFEAVRAGFPRLTRLQGPARPGGGGPPGRAGI